MDKAARILSRLPRRAAVALVLAALLAAPLACGSEDEPEPTTTDTPEISEADGGGEAPSEPPTEEDGGKPSASVVASGLEVPWGVDFLPNGDALISERDSGRLLRLPRGGEPEEVQRLPSQANGEGGLLGIAVSPEYASDSLVYAYYTTGSDNRIARFRLGEKPEPILTGIEMSPIHNGGRIAFGPDGMLYATTGDAGESSRAQDPDSLNGKILRLTPEGEVPADNPTGGSPVYSLGHRNVEGLAWDGDGTPFATEFGESSADEVNRIEPGANYGWPEVEGEGGGGDFVEPITTWEPSEASPAGVTILDGDAPGDWAGEMFVGALAGERLWQLELDGDGSVADRQTLYKGEYGRIRTAVQAPDGSLWLATSNRDGRGNPASSDDRIIRIGE